MSGTTIDDVSEVLARVRSWPVPARIALMQRVLETLGPEDAPPREAIPTAEQLRQIFRTDKPAPDDETIRRWKDEHIMGKYG